MKKPEIVTKLAQQTRVSRAEAADRLDCLVREIRSNLRQGKPAPLPGLGKFVPVAGGGIRFERDKVTRR